MNVENVIRVGATLWMQSLVVLAVGLFGARLLRHRGSLPQMTALRAALLGVALCTIVSAVATSRVPTHWNVSIPPPSFTPTFTSILTAPFVTMKRSTITQRKAPLQTQVAPPSETSVSETSVSAETPVVPIVEEQTAPLSTWENVYLLVARVWLLGSALWLLWLSMCALRLAWVRRSSTRIASGEWHDALKSLCEVHGWHQPQLLQSAEVRSPLLMGLWRPAIVLPREDVFDSASRHAVLLHEMTHLRRRDLWWMGATRVLCAILWPQPLLWILCRQIERVAEDVCDEAVIRGGCAPRDYARCLLDLAERLTLRASERAVAAGVVPRQSSLGQRVRRILDEKRRGAAFVARPLRALISLATLGAIVLAVCAIGIKKRFDAQDNVQEIVAGPLLSSARWQDSPVEKRLPFRPQSQTINGVTIRVLDAKWRVPEWKLRESASVYNDFQKELWVRYVVTSDSRKVRLPKGKSPIQYVTQIRGYDNYGFPNSSADNGNYEWDSGGSIEFGGLDPRQSSVPVEFEFLNPVAPPSATGKFEETLQFNNVPLPGKRDQVLPVGRSFTTAHGTRVFLEAIAVSSAKSGKFLGDENKVLMSMRTLAPAQTPDMKAQLSMNFGDGVVGSNGEKAMTNAGYSVVSDDLLQNHANTVTLYVDALPSFKSRSVNIRVQVSEEAPSLKQDKWFRRFRFQLPQNQISLGDMNSRRPVAVADASDIRVTLDSLKKFGDDYKTHLWFTDKDGANWDWNVASATISDGSNSTWQTDSITHSSQWKQSGRPMQIGENGINLNFSFFGNPGTRIPTPKALEMRLELQAQKRDLHVVNFRNLPLPSHGKPWLLNRTVTFPSGAWFTIRKVESGSFDDQNRAINTKGQPTRIAITYDTNAQANAEHRVDCQQSTGTDNFGHNLGASGVTDSGKALYFLPPSLKATSFNLRLLLAESTQGPRKTVIFHDLPAPKTLMR